MSHLQFCCATFLCDKIASVTCCVAQLFNSRATPLPNRVAFYSVQLCHKNTVNADWSIVYATKLQCVICTVTYCNFVARQNHTIKLQVEHWSKNERGGTQFLQVMAHVLFTPPTVSVVLLLVSL